AEDGIRDFHVTGVQTCALPIYIPLGLHTKEEGLNWSREVENSDTTSHGSQEPTRRDITSDVSGLVVIAQETKAQVLKMFNNIERSEERRVGKEWRTRWRASRER